MSLDASQSLPALVAQSAGASAASPAAAGPQAASAGGSGAPPATLHARECALFLDVDGTLLEFATCPNGVAIDAELRQLLAGLVQCSRGALALVSGRSIANLDALFKPLRLPLSGLHGFERRNAAGKLSRSVSPERGTLREARRLMHELAAQDARLVLEDKRFALALHYRRAPALENLILPAVQSIAVRLGERLEVRRGRMVAELLPRGVNKASAIAEFMAEPPFTGRRPLFVGDDLTDESAFEWVNAAGGLSVAVDVSRPTAAQTRLQSVGEVRAWLRRLLETQG